MSHAEMMAKAWLDEGFRASLIAQGIHVPPAPHDLADDQLDMLADGRREQHQSAVPSCTTASNTT